MHFFSKFVLLLIFVLILRNEKRNHMNRIRSPPVTCFPVWITQRSSHSLLRSFSFTATICKLHAPVYCRVSARIGSLFPASAATPWIRQPAFLPVRECSCAYGRSVHQSFHALIDRWDFRPSGRSLNASGNKKKKKKGSKAATVIKRSA